jgi:hypothetical protein
LRGQVDIDEMYSTESGADEILGACNWLSFKIIFQEAKFSGDYKNKGRKESFVPFILVTGLFAQFLNQWFPIPMRPLNFALLRYF